VTWDAAGVASRAAHRDRDARGGIAVGIRRPAERRVPAGLGRPAGSRPTRPRKPGRRAGGGYGKPDVRQRESGPAPAWIG
jgi:hypothetical protein